MAEKYTVKEETITPKQGENIKPETYSKPSQETETTSKANDDNSPYEGQIFKESEHIQKQTHLNSNSENSKLKQTQSFLEQQEMPAQGLLPKLARECQRDTYSPEPKLLQPDYTHSTDQNVSNTNDYLGTKLKEKTGLHPYSLHDSHNSLQVHPVHSELKQVEPKNSNIFEPNKEAVVDYSKNENHNKSQYYPLNKKLSRYYTEKENDMVKYNINIITLTTNVPIILESIYKQYAMGEGYKLCVQWVSFNNIFVYHSLSPNPLF